MVVIKFYKENETHPTVSKPVLKGSLKFVDNRIYIDGQFVAAWARTSSLSGWLVQNDTEITPYHTVEVTF